MEPHRDDAKVAGLLAEVAWLRRLAGRIDGGRAEDLAQEAILAALTGPAPRGRLRSWLAGIVRNLARDTRRREARRARREACAAARTGGDRCPADEAARSEARGRVAAAIRDLPEPYRATVLLHFFEGLSLADIARREGVKDSTARNRLSRALATLRARLEPELGGAPLALLPLAMPGRRPRLSFGRIAAAAALLAGAVYAGTPDRKAADAAPEAPPQEVTATPLPPEAPPVP
jgi:RNA polymerase sigma-70 factor (ECF subfamily)